MTYIIYLIHDRNELTDNIMTYNSHSTLDLDLF